MSPIAISHIIFYRHTTKCGSCFPDPPGETCAPARSGHQIKGHYFRRMFIIAPGSPAPPPSSSTLAQNISGFPSRRRRQRLMNVIVCPCLHGVFSVGADAPMPSHILPMKQKNRRQLRWREKGVGWLVRWTSVSLHNIITSYAMALLERHTRCCYISKAMVESIEDPVSGCG